MQELYSSKIVIPEPRTSDFESSDLEENVSEAEEDSSNSYSSSGNLAQRMARSANTNPNERKKTVNNQEEEGDFSNSSPLRGTNFKGKTKKRVISSSGNVVHRKTRSAKINTNKRKKTANDPVGIENESEAESELRTRTENEDSDSDSSSQSTIVGIMTKKKKVAVLRSSDDEENEQQIKRCQFHQHFTISFFSY
jgi:hypothetical protein